MTTEALLDATATVGQRTLEVSGLSVEFRTDRGWTQIVDDVSFSIAVGTTLGLVGESGSGKSVTAKAIMGMVGLSGGRITAGKVMLDGRDLTSLGERELRPIRGRDVTMIYQEPRRHLDPSFTVGDQIAEVLRIHEGASRRASERRAVELLDMVGIARAEQRAKDYPHRFSGGMCQRVMIAIALATRPKVLIADEPTTALDVTVQAQILDLLKDLQVEMGLAILFISHDLAVVTEMSDHLGVMYAGQIVEYGPTRLVLHDPSHPYMRALMAARPSTLVDGRRFVAIEGSVPVPGEWDVGCRFAPRCAHRIDRCVEASLPLVRPASDVAVRCARHGALGE